MTVTPSPGRSASTPFTVRDLDALPDDGRFHELVEGVLIVTPGPSVAHQVASAEMLALLRAGCPSDLYVLAAPTDVVLSDTTVLQPDLLVVHRADLGGPRITAVPLMVVEILSPITRAFDLGPRRAAYATGGVPHLWLVDPDVPALVACRLAGTGYEEITTVTGDESYDATEPFAVSVVPSRLHLP